MPLRPRPPAVPPELLDQFGDPEHAFGPNVRFRVVASVCGVALVVMGVLLFVLGVAAAGSKFSNKLAIAWPLVMAAFGALVLFGTRLVPMNWVFVCPRGLLRTRGAAWDGISWAKVDRFEEAPLTHKAVTIRQCRILWKDGTEWGFLADYIADYDRLTEVLRQRVHEGRKPSGAEWPTG